MEINNVICLINSEQKQRVQMKKSNIEGECLIEELTLLKMRKKMLVLTIFLSLITGGLFLLVLKWFFKMRVKFLYKEVNEITQCTHVLIHNSDGTFEVRILQRAEQNGDQFSVSQTQYSFQNRRLTFIYSEDAQYNGYFQALEYPVCNLSQMELKELAFLDSYQVDSNKLKYGKCEKIIEIPTLPSYLFKEMTTPFFFLQYISIVLWIFENYLSFAIIIISVSIAVTILNYVLLRISLLKIQKMAHTPDLITVLRKEASNSFRVLKMQSFNSSEIVVGDIILLQEKLILPCDCILISGETLMNEVSLTGESLPIPKEPIPNSQDLFSYSKELKKHLLFEGTSIFQCKGDENKQVLAKVIRVGFSSFKGQILRSVLYPKPIKIDYYRNSMIYLLGIDIRILMQQYLIIFLTLIGLLAAVLVIYFSRVYEMYSLDFPKQFYFYRFFDTVTWIIPPFLPIFISFSQTLALMRLRMDDIYGIDPQRTFISGKVTHMCFDKTGTLTKDGINVNGYYDENLMYLRTSIDMMDETIIQENMQEKLFSCCHGVYLMNDDLVGDMLDIEMLKFSGYKIANVEHDINIKFKSIHPSKQDELQVLKIFEFSSDNQRMSCIVHDVTQRKHYFFLKGAPEKIHELCQQSTIPSNFTILQNKLSLKGLRIIAMAYKEIPNLKESLTMSSEDLEKNVKFLGFLVLENRLKDDSAECIESLRQAQIDCKIISGDNPLTTLQTGIECTILDSSQKIFYIDTQHHQLTFFKVQNEIIEPYQVDCQAKLSILRTLLMNQEQIVITGKVLDFFYNYLKIVPASNNNCNHLQISETNSSIDDFASDEKSINISRASNNYIANKFELCNQLIRKTQIFSRMRPEQKRIIIENLQNQGFKVGMIGDGANDCAAIKQGDIGISFAAADAAFSAPFSSSNDSIKCVERILLEGRCTMTVNIEIFRTIVTQNVLKYIGVMILLQEAQNFGGFQYTYLSFMNGMPLLIFLALSKPQKKLQPYTPDDKFQGISNSLSMYSQFIIFGIAFIIGYCILSSKSWHEVITELDEQNGLKVYNMAGELNSIIFLMINVFYTSSCLTYYISFPYKETIFRNAFLFPWIILSLAYGIVLVLKPEYTFSALELSSSLFDHSATLVIILITVIVASILALAVEELVIKKYFGPKNIKQMQQN